MNKINITYAILPIQICWLFSNSWYFWFHLSHVKSSEDISLIFTKGKNNWTNLKKKKKTSMSLSLIILVNFCHLWNIYYQFWKKINLKERLVFSLHLLSLKFKHTHTITPCQWRGLITKENCYLYSILAWKHPSFCSFCHSLSR